MKIKRNSVAKGLAENTQPNPIQPNPPKPSPNENELNPKPTQTPTQNTIPSLLSGTGACPGFQRPDAAHVVDVRQPGCGVAQIGSS